MTQTTIRSLFTIVLLSAWMGCTTNEVDEKKASSPAADGEAASALSSEPPPPVKQVVVAGPGELDPRATYRVPLHGGEPQMGPDDALITIVEFGDFDCPFCARRAPTMVELREKYGADLRVIWMNYPVPGHRNARPAATAALEALRQKGNAGFWKMHDLLLTNQGSLNRDTLERLAKQLGLNMRKFRKALDTNKYAEVIDREAALGQKLHIPGTPSYFMNGRFMAGFPLQTWSYAIDRELGKLRRLTESGQVSRADLYEHLIADGKAEP